MAATSTRKSAGKAGSTSSTEHEFVAGDYVSNPLKPEWGPGRVVDVKRGVTFVYWRDHGGKQVIKMKPSFLRPADRDPELEAIEGYIETEHGYAIGKPKKVTKGKKSAPVIKFDIPDDVEIEAAELDLDEIEAEADEIEE